MNKHATVLSVVFLSLLLSACAKTNPQATKTMATTTAIGVVGGAAVSALADTNLPASAAIGGVAGLIGGAYLSRHHHYIANMCFANHCVDSGQIETEDKLIRILYARGIVVVVDGDTRRVIIPTGYFFIPGEYDLNPEHANTLALVKDLLAKYEFHKETEFTVIGYGDDIGSPETVKNRSKDYAMVLASYFEQHGINTPPSKVVSYGEENPIANNRTALGAYDNNRVEILVKLQHDFAWGLLDGLWMPDLPLS